jgi:sporulation protein YlmC with PRC-barrel domain
MIRLSTLALLALTPAVAWGQTSTEQPQPELNQAPVPAEPDAGVIGTDPAVESPAVTTEVPSTSAESSDVTASSSWYTLETGDFRASKLIGMTVRNAAGESIGDINEIVLQKDGEVGAVIIGVGGFLGLGEREVAIPFSQLKMETDADGHNLVSFDAVRDTLAGAPAWTWSN